MGMMIDEVKARCDLGYYAKLCRYHDWTYRQSDDFSCFTRGEREQKTLVRLSEPLPTTKESGCLPVATTGSTPPT